MLLVPSCDGWCSSIRAVCVMTHNELVEKHVLISFKFRRAAAARLTFSGVGMESALKQTMKPLLAFPRLHKTRLKKPEWKRVFADSFLEPANEWRSEVTRRFSQSINSLWFLSVSLIYVLFPVCVCLCEREREERELPWEQCWVLTSAHVLNSVFIAGTFIRT